MASVIISGTVTAPLLVCEEGLSFWGGVDATTGVIVDAHHPQHGQSLAGRIVMMPTSRGSCSGSGVLLDLALAGLAPAAFIFREAEDVLTLGALVADRLFGRKIAVLRLTGNDYAALARATMASMTPTTLSAGALTWDLTPVSATDVSLTVDDRAVLSGRDGVAARTAMEIVCAMAAAQGAERLTDVSRVHIDGCIYAAPAFLTFARKMADMGGRVRVPTTMNAISVDHANWRRQGVDERFGGPASGLADAYVEMGARPSFTCAPYLLADKPAKGEDIAWAESNAVIYANSVLGARTVKHPDFLDLCIALTGRAPRSGVYIEQNRAAGVVIAVDLPARIDDAFWPMLGWLAGQAAPDRIPLIRGLDASAPSEDDLKALCGAFGTTSAAPMLHIAGVTPEADLPVAANAATVRISAEDFAKLWDRFNAAPAKVDLVALGSPHFSHAECKAFAALMSGCNVHADVAAIVTLGRATLDAIRSDGTAAILETAGVKIVPDLCWCSISEPVFPPAARVLMTNSGKYAHYAPGLSKRAVRFGSLAQCATAAITGMAASAPPHWLTPTPRPVIST
ncbi:cis-3-hydroxy-L-proline dehydratase [Dongia rigui]|uniref:Aconitase X n=1 Tax=Dongia rigui TaxID=940149 RepID=A0ABU5DVI5_9PROT|nr:aconitase X [Dongia rigui]MDY0870997.1 aconitase X [Dongia rigui]